MTTTRLPLVLVFALSALAAACATSSKLAEDNLITPETITAVELGTVQFDYTQWTNQNEDAIARAKENESTWAAALGDAFVARIARHGLDGPDARTRIDITIVDLNPGSRAARAWIGFGAGKGVISASVAADAHGSFRMDSKISGGAFGGNFTNVMKELGTEIADHLAARAGK